MFNIIVGAILGVFICSLCSANKTANLEVENYYLSRKVEELRNELYNSPNGKKHD